MYQLYGIQCQVNGIPKSKIKETLIRFEKKYDQNIFEFDKFDNEDAILMLTFYIVDGKYKILFEIEYNTDLAQFGQCSIKKRIKINESRF